MNGFKCFPCKGLSTSFYRLEYYDVMDLAAIPAIWGGGKHPRTSPVEWGG